jgi:hypothetical protein
MRFCQVQFLCFKLVILTEVDGALSLTWRTILNQNSEKNQNQNRRAKVNAAFQGSAFRQEDRDVASQLEKISELENFVNVWTNICFVRFVTKLY